MDVLSRYFFVEIGKHTIENKMNKQCNKPKSMSNADTIIFILYHSIAIEIVKSD